MRAITIAALSLCLALGSCANTRNYRLQRCRPRLRCPPSRSTLPSQCLQRRREGSCHGLHRSIARRTRRRSAATMMSSSTTSSLTVNKGVTDARKTLDRVLEGPSGRAWRQAASTTRWCPQRTRSPISSPKTTSAKASHPPQRRLITMEATILLLLQLVQALLPKIGSDNTTVTKILAALAQIIPLLASLGQTAKQSPLRTSYQP
jgi:hypothetical protein